MEPNYRIKIEVYDSETGEFVVKTDEPKFSQEEEAIAQMYRTLTAFEGRKESFEATHYPVESTAASAEREKDEITGGRDTIND